MVEITIIQKWLHWVSIKIDLFWNKKSCKMMVIEKTTKRRRERYAAVEENSNIAQSNAYTTTSMQTQRYRSNTFIQRGEIQSTQRGNWSKPSWRYFDREIAPQFSVKPQLAAWYTLSQENFGGSLSFNYVVSSKIYVQARSVWNKSI